MNFPAFVPSTRSFLTDTALKPGEQAKIDMLTCFPLAAVNANQFLRNDHFGP